MGNSFTAVRGFFISVNLRKDLGLTRLPTRLIDTEPPGKTRKWLRNLADFTKQLWIIIMIIIKNIIIFGNLVWKP